VADLGDPPSKMNPVAAAATSVSADLKLSGIHANTALLNSVTMTQRNANMSVICDISMEKNEQMGEGKFENS
jgi:hypothetical protein